MSGTSPKPPLGRLVYEVREQICRRLRDKQTGRQINEWLCTIGLGPYNDTNFTNFRKGQYAKWLKEQSRLDDIRDRAESVRRELEAGGFSVLDKAIYELAEKLADPGLDPVKSAMAVSALKNAVMSARRADIAERSTDQRERALALMREKFEEQRARNAEAKNLLEKVSRGGGLSPEALKTIETAAKFL